MPIQGEYAPSARQWVRDQVDQYERSQGQQANTLRDTGLPVIVVTMRGNKSGKVRKIALMRVEHDGEYALVASKGGAEPFDVSVRELSGEERAEWWERAVAAYPPYAEYQTRTQRQIPVFVAKRV